MLLCHWQVIEYPEWLFLVSFFPFYFLSPLLFFRLLDWPFTISFLIFLFLFRHYLMNKKTAWPHAFICLKLEVDPVCWCWCHACCHWCFAPVGRQCISRLFNFLDDEIKNFPVVRGDSYHISHVDSFLICHENSKRDYGISILWAIYKYEISSNIMDRSLSMSGPCLWVFSFFLAVSNIHNQHTPLI